ncbi:DoxX family protein [Candidatus Nitronereus thalassa]|uniref:DoxX family protein n=1 Tax=Candidatus Nitronereus thalassa TaxID=3020898 RepID=A0ABU3KBG4_9BACT|nr:DoxX family protein [Candidatus Nitronereus thalassa]MDT7043743.1 DoxX family protein [Candidatus Nitronereus thalassa]
MKYNNYIMLAGRTMLAAIFLLSGFNKIFNPASTQEYMTSMGMPATEIFLFGAIVVEIVAGLSLLLGFWTQVGAAMLFLFMIPTTWIFHTHFSNQTQFIMFLKNIAMMGGLLYVYVFGPGAWSLDALVGRHSRQFSRQTQQAESYS